MTIEEEVCGIIETEIQCAIAKHGAQEGHPDYMWALIAGEEMGEIQQAILQTGVMQDAKTYNGRVFDEVVQLAAVTTYWVRLMLKRQLTEEARDARKLLPVPPSAAPAILTPQQIKKAREIISRIPSVGDMVVQPIDDPLNEGGHE